MKDTKISGFLEESHTADVAVRAWGPDLPALLEQAARGMYALMGARRGTDTASSRRLELSPAEAEAVLVAFLSELLYALESESWLAAEFAFEGSPEAGMSVMLSGGRAAGMVKEIKAVTYNDLSIVTRDDRLETIIVFDV